MELPADEHQEQRFLSPDEVALLADNIDPRYRAFVLLGAYGGLRAGELLGLRIGRLDPLKSAVRVCETVIEVRGTLLTGTPKTDAGVRTVPIPRAVADVLVEHSAGRDADEWMFPAPKGGAMRLGLFRTRFWRPAVNASGLDGLRIHDLRHTAVSFWLLTKKANAKDVATWAGHSSVATILDRYGHLLPGHEEEPMAALDVIFRAAEAHKPRAATVENLDDYRDDDDPPAGVLAVV